MAIGLEHDFETMAHPEAIPISRSAVLRALSQVLESKPFRTSKQCQNFLRYVVSNTVDSHDEALKERVIGAAVLERPPDYNTADDPVVRIRAADVRKRLAMYYQDEGRDAGIRITIPSGSYRAFFHHSHLHAESVLLQPDPLRSDPISDDVRLVTAGIEAMSPFPVEATHALPIQSPAATRAQTGKRRVLLAVASLMLIAVAGFTTWYLSGESQRQFNLFWAPTLDQPRPPILYVGSNAVYRLSNSFLQRYQAAHPGYNGLESLPAIDRTESISGSDLDEDDKDSCLATWPRPSPFPPSLKEGTRVSISGSEGTSYSAISEPPRWFSSVPSTIAGPSNSTTRCRTALP